MIQPHTRTVSKTRLHRCLCIRREKLVHSAVVVAKGLCSAISLHTTEHKNLPCYIFFQVVVAPGPTTSSTSEAEGDASPAMDALVEGVAGMTGYFNIQVTTTALPPSKRSCLGVVNKYILAQTPTEPRTPTLQHLLARRTCWQQPRKHSPSHAANPYPHCTVPPTPTLTLFPLFRPKTLSATTGWKGATRSPFLPSYRRRP